VNSAKKLGKIFGPTELRFSKPERGEQYAPGGEESFQRRKHVTENIAH
jgi:hypothetical protein